MNFVCVCVCFLCSSFCHSILPCPIGQLSLLLRTWAFQMWWSRLTGALLKGWGCTCNRCQCVVFLSCVLLMSELLSESEMRVILFSFGKLGQIGIVFISSLVTPPEFSFFHISNQLLNCYKSFHVSFFFSWFHCLCPWRILTLSSHLISQSISLTGFLCCNLSILWNSQLL